MAKVAMCAGHGGSGSTPGKRSPAGEYEWNFNDAVVRAAIAKLKANGVEVLRTDDASGKTDIGLTARTNKANAWGADVYVSCHHNALGTSWLNYEIGIETFTQNGSHPQAEILAKCIHPKYVKAMGLKDRGMKKSNLAITRQTKMPAVLTEGGFMDSRIDIKSMRDNAKLKSQGEAIADGIMEFLNVNNTNSAPDKVSKPKEKQTGSEQITKSKTNTGGSIVDYLKSQGIDSSKANRKKLAAKSGISNYTGTAAQNTQLLNKLKSGSKPVDKPKSSGDAYIRGVQQFVVNYGFKIAVDGYKGPETKKALIKVLQSELNKQFGAGLAVDGIPGPKTYAALITVRKGAKGNITKVLQALLYIAGHNPGKLDGKFGADTENAIRAYQKAKGLTVDSTPGRATWTKLIA